MPDRPGEFRGNPHHLAVLTEAIDKNDVTIWNSFARRSGGSFRARLAGASLPNVNLNEIRLVGADLSDTNFSGASLVHADLSNARMRGAALDGADLTGARIVGTDFSSALLRGANLVRARGRKAVFTRADLSESVLDDADLSEAVMRGAEVRGTSRNGVKMKVRIKPRRAEEWADASEEPRSLNHSPWLKAREEEEKRKKRREIRERELAELEQRRLDRNLGRRKPLFKRIK